MEIRQQLTFQHKSSDFVQKRYNRETGKWSEIHHPLMCWIEIKFIPDDCMVYVHVKGNNNPFMCRDFAAPRCEVNEITKHMLRKGYELIDFRTAMEGR